LERQYQTRFHDHTVIDIPGSQPEIAMDEKEYKEQSGCQVVEGLEGLIESVPARNPVSLQTGNSGNPTMLT